MRSSLLALWLLVLFVLVGCGGSGVGGPGLPPTSELALSGDDAYNGTDAPLEGYPGTQRINGRTIVTLGGSSRMLRLDLPTPVIADGQTFAIGGEGGASARLTEVQERETISRTWIGTSGSVTVRVDAQGQVATVELHAANFQGDATVEGNLANGSFTLEGNLLGVEFSGGGNVGGDSELAFSQVVNVNASTASLNSGLVVYANVEEYGLLTVSTGTASDGRILTINLRPTAKAGDEIILDGPQNSKASVVFAAGNGNPAKIWLAKSGTLRIVARSTTEAKVELVNATFTNPSPQTGNAARGTFILNGTLETD
jgi:hypothetical protein